MGWQHILHTTRGGPAKARRIQQCQIDGIFRIVNFRRRCSKLRLGITGASLALLGFFLHGDNGRAPTAISTICCSPKYDKHSSSILSQYHSPKCRGGAGSRARNEERSAAEVGDWHPQRFSCVRASWRASQSTPQRPQKIQPVIRLTRRYKKYPWVVKDTFKLADKLRFSLFCRSSSSYSLSIIYCIILISTTLLIQVDEYSSHS